MTSQAWSVPDGVLWAEGDESIFVLDSRELDPRPRRLDGGGRLIWGLLSQRRCTTEELVRSLVDMTGEEEQSIREGTLPFLEQMHALGFLDYQ